MDLARRRSSRPLIASLVAAALVAGCTAHRALPAGDLAVPTDDKLVSSTESPILCTLSASIPPLVGTFEADRSDPEWPVWLRAEDGRRMYVLWPRDFSVRFDPDATLLDETGAIVVHAGSPVHLAQVSADPTMGTKDRPYVASGLWETGLGKFGHCYNRPAELIGDVRPLIVALGVALVLTFGIALVLLPPGRRDKRNWG